MRALQSVLAALFNWQPPRLHGLFGHFVFVKKHFSSLVVRLFLFAMGLCFWSFPALAQNKYPDPIEITSQFTERKIGRDIAVILNPAVTLFPPK